LLQSSPYHNISEISFSKLSSKIAEIKPSFIRTIGATVVQNHETMALTSILKILSGWQHKELHGYANKGYKYGGPMSEVISMMANAFIENKSCSNSQ
jgi:hypothetical protein